MGAVGSDQNMVARAKMVFPLTLNAEARGTGEE
jgi:hypothetical protein